MDLKIKEFEKFSRNSWNDLLLNLEGQSHLCTWNDLCYYSAFPKIKNLSFAVFNENKIVALVPMAKRNLNKKITFSFGNNNVFSPLFSSNISPSLRKKIYSFIFDFLKKKNKLKKIDLTFQVSPFFFNKDNLEISSKNQFEILSFSKDYIVHNTLVLDLLKDESLLINNMSKYHRRNIKKTSKLNNLKVEIIDYQYSKKIIGNKFGEFRKFHKISAGRITRPKKTWDLMLKKIYDNEAELFILNFGGKSVSFLFCARYKTLAWGWSQVNIKKYENISPRHFLEWNAIKYYKKNNLKYYEIGERYYKQKKFSPTDKELTISEFKEKYGSDKYPKAYFRVNF